VVLVALEAEDRGRRTWEKAGKGGMLSCGCLGVVI
jgi:hypothetical protein